MNRIGGSVSSTRVAVVFSALIAAILGASSNAAEYYWTGASGDNLWATPGNWSANTVPTSADTFKPDSTTTVTVDLGNETRTIAQLDLSSARDAYPAIEVRNGTLLLTGGITDGSSQGWSQDNGIMTESHTSPFNLVNATLTARTLFRSGHGRTRGYMYIVNDGSQFILDHVDMLDQFTWVKVLPGGTANFTFGNTVQKNGDSTCRSTWANEGGTFSFPEGFTLNRTAGSGWSKRASFRIQQKSGVMILGGNVSRGNAAQDGGNAMGLFFQWFGGTVHAVSNVAFIVDAEYQYNAKTEKQESCIASDASVTAEVDEGKTMDMSGLVLHSGVFLTKIGAGTLILPDVPYSLNLQGGTTAFADNTTAAMGTLEVGAGQTFEFAHGNTTLGTLVENAGTITLSAPGLTISAVDANATLTGSFVVNASSFVEGDVLVTTSSVVLREKIAADATAAKVSTRVEGNSLIVAASEFTFVGGAQGAVTDYSNPANWSCGYVPTNEAVVVRGDMDISGDFPAFASISVEQASTVTVSGAISLPALRLSSDSALAVSAGASVALDGLSSSATAEEIPVLTVASGATLTVPAGYKFANMDLRLYGTLTESGDGSLVFGYAETGVTNYFAMTAEGATITALNAAGTENAARIDFASPVAGGTVVVVGDIVMKDGTITYNSKDGFAFGLNNPTSEAFRVVVDNTTLNFGNTSYVAGGANLVLTNNAVMFRARNNGGSGFNGDAASNYNLCIQNRGRITLVDGGELRAGITMGNGNKDNGVIKLDPDETGYVGIDVQSGGVANWYKLNGQGKGVVRFNDAVYKCYMTYWWGQSNRELFFYNLAGMEIDADSTLTFTGVGTKVINVNDSSMDAFEFSAPVTGGGNLTVVNTRSGKTLTGVVTSGRNTCTGTFSLGDDSGSAKVRGAFADGANWAGTVAWNDRVDLVDRYAPTETSRNAPVTVSFGAVEMTADFPIRVWENDGVYTNDMVNITGSGWTASGRAAIDVVLPDGLTYDDVEAKQEFPLGTISAKAVAEERLPAVKDARHYEIYVKPIDGDETKFLYGIRRSSRRGMVIYFL